MTAPVVIPQWARNARPANVRATGSDAPEHYTPLEGLPDVYTHAGHAAQYGKGRRNGRTIRLAILHTTESNSFLSSMIYDAYRPETVSATAHVGELGEIGAGVPEADRPWTTGRWNDESLAMEIVGRAAWSAAQWRARPRQMAAIATLLTDWCRRHSLPAVWLSAAQIAEGASRQGSAPVQGVRRGICDHLMANQAAIALGGSVAAYSHHDIGPGLREVVLADIIPEVARRLAGGTPAPTPTFRWRDTMITGCHMLDDDGERIIDTRPAPNRKGPHGRLKAGKAVRIAVPDPDDGTGRQALAAIVNVTSVNPAGPGHLGLSGAAFTGTSRLNYTSSEPAPKPNTTVVNVSRDSGGAYFLARAHVADVDLIVDLIGVLS